MKKRPPLVLYSAIVGVLLAIVLYQLAAGDRKRNTVRSSLQRMNSEEVPETTVEGDAPLRSTQQLTANQDAERVNLDLDMPQPEMLDPSEILAMPPEPSRGESQPMISRGALGQLPERFRPGTSASKPETSVIGDAPAKARAEKEDEVGAAARKFLTLVIARRAKAIGKKPVRYVAPWVKTEYSDDRQSAIVFFSGEDVAPDCDVHLRFDARRKKWNVTHVQGGGFGSFTP